MFLERVTSSCVTPLSKSRGRLPKIRSFIACALTVALVVSTMAASKASFRSSYNCVDVVSGALIRSEMICRRACLCCWRLILGEDIVFEMSEWFRVMTVKEFNSVFFTFKPRYTFLRLKFYSIWKMGMWEELNVTRSCWFKF